MEIDKKTGKGFLGYENTINVKRLKKVNYNDLKVIFIQNNCKLNSFY